MNLPFKKTLFAVMLILIFSTVQAGQEKDFSWYSSQVLAIDAKPGSHVEETKLFIIHPLIKQKETILRHISKLSWKGNKCIRTFTGFKVVKGRKPRGDTGVGKKVRYHYISKELKNFCSSKAVTGWNIKDSMKLDETTCQGYSFMIKISGQVKEGMIYLSGDGMLKAMALGFPENGISHAKEMKDNATVWYFKTEGGKLRLTGIKKYTVQKKRGIPIIKTVNVKFGNF